MVVVSTGEVVAVICMASARPDKSRLDPGFEHTLSPPEFEGQTELGSVRDSPQCVVPSWGKLFLRCAIICLDWGRYTLPALGKCGTVFLGVFRAPGLGGPSVWFYAATVRLYGIG